MAGLLVAGTSSDAGKSIIVTGLCRLLARRGLCGSRPTKRRTCRTTQCYVFGTMWHGCLESDEFRALFLAAACDYEVSPVDFAAARDSRIELLADLLEQHVDTDALLTLIESAYPRTSP